MTSPLALVWFGLTEEDDIENIEENIECSTSLHRQEKSQSIPPIHFRLASMTNSNTNTNTTNTNTNTDTVVQPETGTPTCLQSTAICSKRSSENMDSEGQPKEIEMHRSFVEYDFSKALQMSMSRVRTSTSNETLPCKVEARELRNPTGTLVQREM